MKNRNTRASFFEKKIVNLAIMSLIKEATLHPKPGLVDLLDNGAHDDMNVRLFIRSAYSFRPAFKNYLSLGYFHTGNEKNLLEKVRIIGVEAEKNMFIASGGINTHKGANFTYALFLSALGLYFRRLNVKPYLPLDFMDIKNIFIIIKSMTKDLVKDDFKNVKEKQNPSYGEVLYLKYGFLGIREEAALGYPTVIKSALPRLIKLDTYSDYTEMQKHLEVLFLIMSTLDDSNLISRGGFEALNYVKKLSSYFLISGGVAQNNYIKIIKHYNEKFKLLHISPGGSADILAFTIFLKSLL